MPSRTAGVTQTRELIAFKKPRGRVWPGLTSVGGDIQPHQVTVLTPATYRRWEAFYSQIKIRQSKKPCISPAALPEAKFSSCRVPYRLRSRVIIRREPGCVNRIASLEPQRNPKKNSPLESFAQKVAQPVGDSGPMTVAQQFTAGRIGQGIVVP